MNRLLSATVCGWLALAVCMGSPARSSGASPRIAATDAADPEASAAAGDMPQSSWAAHGHMPRYYINSYTYLDEKGNPHPLDDVVQFNDIIERIVRWGIAPDRILGAAPRDCSKANPCEELDMREETDGIYVTLTTTIQQKPVVPSNVPHHSLSSSTAKKENWLRTRCSLAADVSHRIWVHDQLHQNSH